jgi:hypothetical protein
MKNKLLLLLLGIFPFLNSYTYAADDYAGNTYINNDYTGDWGRLKLVGVQLSSEAGEAIQLKGWSTHGWQFGNVRKITFDSEAGFKGMKSFGANIARIAAYMSPQDQVSDENVLEIIEWVKRCMAWTHELNMYCIVDFHVHDPGFPTYYLKDGNEEVNRDAEDFFRQICEEVNQKGYKHVLYEICNEPSGKSIPVIGGVSAKATWEDVKTYASRILPIIAENDPGAIVIIGTPSACLRIDVAAEDLITYPGLNIMYSFHFYACSHLNDFNRYLKVYSSEIPVFASEWSITKADGSSDVCLEDAAQFTDYCRDNKISWCSWSWCAKNEKSAAIKASSRVNDSYIYSESDLTEAGVFVKNKIQEIPGSGLSDVENTLFKISPNPVKKGTFEISLTENHKAVVDIVTMNGQKVYSTDIENRNTVINVGNLSSGMYIVSVKAGAKSFSEKLVIE